MATESECKLRLPSASMFVPSQLLRGQAVRGVFSCLACSVVFQQYYFVFLYVFSSQVLAVVARLRRRGVQ